MSSSLTGDVETTSPSRGGLEKIAFIAVKLIVTGGCFWLVSRQIDAGTGRWLQTTRILEVERNPCLADADLRRPESGQPAG